MHFTNPADTCEWHHFHHHHHHPWSKDNKTCVHGGGHGGERENIREILFNTTNTKTQRKITATKQVYFYNNIIINMHIYIYIWPLRPRSLSLIKSRTRIYFIFKGIWVCPCCSPYLCSKDTRVCSRKYRTERIDTPRNICRNIWSTDPKPPLYCTSLCISLHKKVNEAEPLLVQKLKNIEEENKAAKLETRASFFSFLFMIS